MTLPAASVTFVVVGTDDEACRGTLESIEWQTPDSGLALRTTPGGLATVLDAIATDWVSVLPSGTQLDPLWLSKAVALLEQPKVGAVGGATLELRGAQTSARWFETPVRVAFIDSWGRCHSLLEHLPNSPMQTDALFLRWDNMVCRTRIVREAMRASDDVTAARYAMAPCARAARLGLHVMYDSALRSTRSFEPAADGDLALHKRDASREILELAQLPGRLRAACAVSASLLVGTRVSPGLVLGLAYAWWPRRRARWSAFVSGKLNGLRRARQRNREASMPPMARSERG